MLMQNKNYKDTVFRRLFSDRVRLLELYNAINKTHYNNPDELIIRTLNGSTFLGMKNDVSFVIDYEINLYEHNSTPCPNIPLRDLFYIASSYRKIIPMRDTYKAEMIKIPAPRFYVFYNGTAPLPDKKEHRLSEMFVKSYSNLDLELVVTILNINEGRNQELMQSCKTLREYSIFVSKVRKYTHKAKLEHPKEDYRKNKKSIVRDAVTIAIDECIMEDVLRDFFVANRKEAIDMCTLECTTEEQLKVLSDESYDKGVTDTNDFYSWLFNSGRFDDAKKAASNKSDYTHLYSEYKESISKKSN